MRKRSREGFALTMILAIVALVAVIGAVALTVYISVNKKNTTNTEATAAVEDANFGLAVSTSPNSADSSKTDVHVTWNQIQNPASGATLAVTIRRSDGGLVSNADERLVPITSTSKDFNGLTLSSGTYYAQVRYIPTAGVVKRQRYNFTLGTVGENNQSSIEEITAQLKKQLSGGEVSDVVTDGNQVLLATNKGKILQTTDFSQITDITSKFYDLSARKNPTVTLSFLGSQVGKFLVVVKDAPSYNYAFLYDGTSVSTHSKNYTQKPDLYVSNGSYALGYVSQDNYAYFTGNALTRFYRFDNSGEKQIGQSKFNASQIQTDGTSWVIYAQDSSRNSQGSYYLHNGTSVKLLRQATVGASDLFRSGLDVITPIERNIPIAGGGSTCYVSLQLVTSGTTVPGSSTNIDCNYQYNHLFGYSPSKTTFLRLTTRSQAFANNADLSLYALTNEGKISDISNRLPVKKVSRRDQALISPYIFSGGFWLLELDGRYFKLR